MFKSQAPEPGNMLYYMVKRNYGWNKDGVADGIQDANQQMVR